MTFISTLHISELVFNVTRCNWGMEPNCVMAAMSVCEQLFCVGSLNQGNHFSTEIVAMHSASICCLQCSV